jgi:dipeptidyl aminopeptidase/acylaminoacyl peptidase
MRVALTLVLLTAFAGVSGAAAAPQPRIVFAADRAGTRNGEIYSFDLVTGVTRDISRSFAYDSGPSVSPDGRWIAFGSTRNGTLGVYVAGTDGSGARLIKQFHRGLTALDTRWSPDGSRIAAISTSGSELWIGTPAGFGVTRWDAEGFAPSAWSPDGQYYAYLGGDAALNVIDARGRLLWHRYASQLRGSFGWSADDRLAWSDDGSGHIVTAAGLSLPGFPAESVAWSPDGRTLAVVRVHSIELRSDGTRPPRTVYRRAAPASLSTGIRWLGATHVVVTPQNADRDLRVDIRTGKGTGVDYADVIGAVSPDLRSIVSEEWSSAFRGRALRVAPLLGRPNRVVAQSRDCSDDHSDPFDHYQFVPRKRMVVYLADCGDPTADLYSMRADGMGVRQLTYTAAHEQTPVLSPDGSQIAYIKSISIGHGCEGCPSELWVMNANGSHARRLTSPGIKNEIGDWDANPSWSPDGKSIVFDRAGSSSWLGLFVISAARGSPRSLHIAGARQALWGPHRIAYSGELGAIWTAKPDGSDRREVAPRHTCDSFCYYVAQRCAAGCAVDELTGRALERGRPLSRRARRDAYAPDARARRDLPLVRGNREGRLARRGPGRRHDRHLAGLHSRHDRDRDLAVVIDMKGRSRVPVELHPSRAAEARPVDRHGRPRRAARRCERVDLRQHRDALRARCGAVRRVDAHGPGGGAGAERHGDLR